MIREQLNFIKNEHVKNNINIYKENNEIIKLYEEYIENVIELFDIIKNGMSDYFYAIVCDILIDIGFFLQIEDSHQKMMNSKKYLSNEELIL